MYLKASKHPAVVVLNVSFSDPVVSVRRSISFKLNPMDPVVMFVHIASLSKCKSDCVWWTRSTWSWRASVRLLLVRLAADWWAVGLEGLRYQLPQASYAV